MLILITSNIYVPLEVHVYKYLYASRNICEYMIYNYVNVYMQSWVYFRHVFFNAQTFLKILLKTNSNIFIFNSVSYSNEDIYDYASKQEIEKIKSK